MSENASDALKMASAILLFVMALSLAIFSFSRVQSISKKTMSKLDSGRTFYDIDNIEYNGRKLNITSNKIVGVDTVIPMMYSYYDEGVTILFYSGRMNDEGKIYDMKPLPLYATEALDSKLQNSNLIDGNRYVYGLDLDDEMARQEPWSHNRQFVMNFIRDIVNGLHININDDAMQKYSMSRIVLKHPELNKRFNNNTMIIGAAYNSASLSGAYYTLNTSLVDSKARFVERIGQYNYSATVVATNTIYSDSAVSGSDINYGEYRGAALSGSVDKFTDENNRVVGFLENTKDKTKRIVQYIYIRE